MVAMTGEYFLRDLSKARAAPCNTTLLQTLVGKGGRGVTHKFAADACAATCETKARSANRRATTRSPLKDKALQPPLGMFDAGCLDNALLAANVHRSISQRRPCNAVLLRNPCAVKERLGMALRHSCPALRRPTRREEGSNGGRSLAKGSPVYDAQHGDVTP